MKLSDSSESTVCLWFTLVLSFHESIAIDVDGFSMSRLQLMLTGEGMNVPHALYFFSTIIVVYP